MYLKQNSTHKNFIFATLLLALSASTTWAQATPPSSARQLPASGGQPGSTAMQQSAMPSPTPSVNTLNTQVRVQGVYAGSALDPNAPTGAITLTLADAVRRGLQFNLGKIGADTASRQAEAQRLAARSVFLPNVSAGLSENAAKINLEAEGLSANTFGAAAGEFPTTAGPFHYYDARGSLQQTVMDFTAVHNYHSAKDSANAASLNAIQSREEVVLAVAGSYLQLMATAALIDAQRTEVEVRGS